MPFDETLSRGDLLGDTQIQSDAERPGVYRATVTPSFVALSAQGGLLMTLALRAVAAELGDGSFAPLSAHGLYCEPVPPGPVEIQVQLLRSGRSVCQACAQLRVQGSEAVALHATATFARPKADPPVSFDQRVYPEDVALPEALSEPVIPEEVLEVLKMFPLQFQADWKVAVGNPGWEQDWDAGEGRFAVWSRMHRPPMDEAGQFDAFCYPYYADAVTPAVIQALGPQQGAVFMMPTLNFDVQFLRPTRSEWLLHHIRTWEAQDGFVHGTMELWDTDRRLVALGSQRALIRKLSA